MIALFWLGLFMLAVLAALGALAAGLAYLFGGEPWTAAITACAVALRAGFAGVDVRVASLGRGPSKSERELARLAAAAASAERERQVLDDTLRAQAEHDAERAEIEATRVESEARRTTARKRLHTSVDATGSTADEANRRIEARERGEP